MRKHIFKCKEIGPSIRVVVSFDRETDFAESSGKLGFCKQNIYILSVCIKRKCYFEGIEESNKNVTQRPRKM